MGIKSYQDLAFTRAQYPAVLMTRFSTPSPSKATTRVWLAKYAPKMHIWPYLAVLDIFNQKSFFLGLPIVEFRVFSRAIDIF